MSDYWVTAQWALRMFTSPQFIALEGVWERFTVTGMGGIAYRLRVASAPVHVLSGIVLADYEPTQVCRNAKLPVVCEYVYILALTMLLDSVIAWTVLFRC